MGHFPQKSPTINVSFAEIDLQLKAFYKSLPKDALDQNTLLLHRMAKMPRMPSLYRAFSAKEPYN